MDEGVVLISISLSEADSELTLSIMDGRPHLFHNLPLPSRFLHWYQVILLGDRGTRV